MDSGLKTRQIGKRDLNSVRGLFKVLQIAQKRQICEASRLPACCDLCRFFAESKTDKRQINVKVQEVQTVITYLNISRFSRQ